MYQRCVREVDNLGPDTEAQKSDDHPLNLSSLIATRRRLPAILLLPRCVSTAREQVSGADCLLLYTYEVAGYHADVVYKQHRSSAPPSAAATRLQGTLGYSRCDLLTQSRGTPFVRLAAHSTPR